MSDLIKQLHECAKGCQDQRMIGDAYVMREAAAEITRLREALTPSGDTKAAYSGEFSISVYDGESEDGGELYRKVLIDWTTIKAIMATIRARAALTAYKETVE